MGVLLLFLTTFIWGTAFLAQKYGADSLGPVAFTVARNILGGGFLLVILAVRALKRRRRDDGCSVRRSVWAGCCCAVPLFAAMSAQQQGIAYTMPGVSAFLTTNYVLFVPVLGAILTRRLPRAYVWFGAAMALGGTYLICLTGSGAPEGGFAGIGKGELWTILCAFCFAVQMLTVDRFARSVDLLVMSTAQLFACAAVGLPFLLLPSEAAKLSEASILAAGWPLVYCGVFSSGIAYTLQNVAQAHVPAALAGILLSLESVFGALAGWAVLGDQLSAGQLLGCATVFAAVIVSQLFSTADTADVV